jgi:hypothetical protein
MSVVSALIFIASSYMLARLMFNLTEAILTCHHVDS